MNVVVALTIVGVSIAYALLRYVAYGSVELANAPSFLFNKAVAMATVAFLCLLAWAKLRQDAPSQKFWAKASLHATVVHVVLSCALLSPGYYPKFFGLDQLNLLGEVTILLGSLSAYCFWVLSRGRDLSERGRFWFMQLALWLIAGHLLAMGFKGWLTVGKWHGGLPPISLLSFMLVVTAYALLLKSRISVVTEQQSTSVPSSHDDSAERRKNRELIVVGATEIGPQPSRSSYSPQADQPIQCFSGAVSYRNAYNSAVDRREDCRRMYLDLEDKNQPLSRQ
jgi:hypothetical protein